MLRHDAAARSSVLRSDGPCRVSAALRRARGSAPAAAAGAAQPEGVAPSNASGAAPQHHEGSRLQLRKVNFHFTRRCNASCGFCFHTAKNGTLLPLAEARRGLAMLRDAGLTAVNFAGGEPFLEAGGTHLAELARYCKHELALPAVSVVSNGSLVSREWLQQHGGWLDVLALSCDSFDEATNVALGRSTAHRGDDAASHVAQVFRVAEWCREVALPFKLNTVVTALNAGEDMRAPVAALAPVRWKLFQCLLLRGENAGPGALRDGARFAVDDAAFAAFVARHVTPQGQLCGAAHGGAPTRIAAGAAVEDNSAMRNSYLILDERMRFLNCAGGGKEPGPSLLDVGVAEALRHAGFDEDAFVARGGDWALPAHDTA